MIEMLFQLNPGFYFIFAGILAAVMPVNAVRKVLLVFVPLFAGFMIFQIYGTQEVLGGRISIGPQELITLRIDRLSMVWGYIFCLAGILNGIYGLHEKCKITDSSALIYMGAALCGVFSGDLLTLFIFWELAAISSVMLVWKGGEHSFNAGVRYLAIHVLSGVLLLAGAVIYGRANGGDFSFGHIGIEAPGGLLLLLAMGIKCGFPLLHNWIQDAYPKASITGTVILSAFTTKLALYALARGFAGTDILIYIGAVMTVFPVFFAVIENDLRRVLSYSLNNQLGFMVCGIGIGTPLAMNGVAGHVVADIIFKGLLFMSMGAVMLRAALYHAEHSHMIRDWVVLAMLLFASAGVMEHSGIKVPYFTFFAHDSGKRVEEAPWNMLLAMGLASVLCIFLAFPWGGYQFLYSLYPHERRAEILDFDWTYRRLGKDVMIWGSAMWTRLGANVSVLRQRVLKSSGNRLHHLFSPAGALSEATPSGFSAALTAGTLVVTLILIFVGTS